MSVIALPEPNLISPNGDRLLTVADFAQLPTDLPSGPVIYELDDGRLVVMPPAGDIHGAVEARWTYALVAQGELKGLGKARCGDVSIILRRNPDRVVGADAAFISNSRLPLRCSKEGFLETIPDLIIEVRSKNDTIAKMERKAKEYLAAGSIAVLVADPIQKEKVVREYRADQELKQYGIDDILTLDDIIPGFRLAVRDVFVE